MTKDFDNPRPAGAHAPTSASAPVEQPLGQSQYVFLETAWGAKIAGTVLKADAELIATLERERIKFREATDFERRIGAPGLD